MLKQILDDEERVRLCKITIDFCPYLYYRPFHLHAFYSRDIIPPGGGGGEGAWVFKGRIRSLSKLKNTTKVLSGQKAPL